MDLLGPDIFSTLRMKGQVLHCEWAHLKVPDWSLVWNELLTKNICGGCFTRFGVIKVLRMIDLTMWSWGWSVRVIGMWWVFSFSAVCSTYCWSIFLAQWWQKNNWHITSNFSEKLESSLYKQQSLRDHEKGMEFLTCDRCEDEYK